MYHVKNRVVIKFLADISAKVQPPPPSYAGEYNLTFERKLRELRMKRMEKSEDKKKKERKRGKRFAAHT